MTANDVKLVVSLLFAASLTIWGLSTEPGRLVIAILALTWLIIALWLRFWRGISIRWLGLLMLLAALLLFLERLAGAQVVVYLLSFAGITLITVRLCGLSPMRITLDR